MAIVFAAIADARVSFMMLFGTGLTLAVLMDATVVRGILVPGLHAAGRALELVGAGAAGPPARRIGLSETPCLADQHRPDRDRARGPVAQSWGTA